MNQTDASVIPFVPFARTLCVGALAFASVCSASENIPVTADSASVTLPATAVGESESSAATVNDPYFEEVLYYQSLSDPLSALGHLQAARHLHRIQQDTATVDLLLGQLYGDYDMPQLSADSYDRVTGNNALRSMAAYRLAEFYYRRGDYTRASSALSQARAGLPYELESKKPFLQSLILMSAGRNAEAINTIDKWQTPLQYDPYTRYDIGVAQMRTGNLLVGAGFLDGVGVMSATTDEMLSLRDQSNLAMGYGFLRADQGATARPIFKRVRLDGPYSNRALLGAGWAELAPDGIKQQNLRPIPSLCIDDPVQKLKNSHYLVSTRPMRPACDEDPKAKMRGYFTHLEGGKTESERLRRALTPWQVLIQRSPADPAVQEALLAVPYAYSRLKNRDQAVLYYRQAITAYEQERNALNQLMDIVRTGPIHAPAVIRDTDLSWQATVWNLPRIQDAYYLQDLFAGYALPAALADYRDLQQLAKNLLASSERLDSVAQSTGINQTAQLASTEPSTVPTEAATQPAAQQVTALHILNYGMDEDSGLGIPLTATDNSHNEPASQTAATADTTSLTLRSDRYKFRLHGLQREVTEALSAQERAVRGLVLAQLEHRRHLLETYLAQAHFSLAHLLDPAMSLDHS